MVKKAKTPVKVKRHPTKKLVKSPSEYVFWCHDGSIFSDLEELVEGLEAMSDETYAYHSNLEKHDFANWVRDVIGDAELADELEYAFTRPQAVECVITRIY